MIQFNYQYITGYPTPELLEWIVWHFPQADQLHKEMILEAKVFRDHRNYWPTV